MNTKPQTTKTRLGDDDHKSRVPALTKEINDTDLRDQRDSATDWEAEQSRTSRHK